MKKIFLIIAVLIFTTVSYSQYYKLRANEGMLSGGTGVTWIDGDPYYHIRLNPELEFAEFGIGLDLKLEFNADGNIRTENFNDFSDYMSIIRYVRYGYKNDPLYLRLGALDYATLGHGSIMYLYNNSISYDNRKVGVEFDMDFTGFGFESVYSSFGEAGIIGVRGFVRPLLLSSELRDIPIINDLEVGATIVSDFHEDAGVVAAAYNPVSEEIDPIIDEGNVTAVGFDLGLPVIETSMLNVDLYLDYVKFLDFGSGVSTGFILDFNGLGLVDLKAKFERRFNGDKYLPSYFNQFYEIDRLEYNPETGAVESKAQRMEFASNGDNGFYGSILISLLNTFDVVGSYQRLDKDPKSGILHLETQITPENSSVVIRGGYDKKQIQDEKDLFTLDERSYLYAEAGYKPMEYLIVSLVYHYTFTPLRGDDDNIIGYEPQRRVEPRVSFVYPIDLR